MARQKGIFKVEYGFSGNYDSFESIDPGDLWSWLDEQGYSWLSDFAIIARSLNDSKEYLIYRASGKVYFKDYSEALKESSHNVGEEENNNNPIQDVQAKEVIQKYLDIISSSETNRIGMLQDLGLSVNVDYNDKFVQNEGSAGEIVFVNTNVKYSDFKNEMLKYIDEALFNGGRYSNFINKDGMLYAANGGATSYDSVIKSIEYKGINDGKFEYEVNVISRNVDGSLSDEDWIFYLKEQNGYLVVDYNSHLANR